MDVPIVKLTLPDEILDKAREVLASGMWVDHDEVHALEQEFAEYCGVKYCRASKQWHSRLDDNCRSFEFRS